MKSDNPIVYSTEKGRICPKCGNAQANCTCKRLQKAPIPTVDGIIRVRREKKGRGGKEVCVIRGIPGDSDTLQKHLKELKKKLGTGGSCKNGIIEIQGNWIEAILTYFNAMGLKIKQDGG